MSEGNGSATLNDFGTSRQYAGWQSVGHDLTREQYRLLEAMMVQNDAPAWLSRTTAIFEDLLNRNNRNLEEDCGYPRNTENISPEFYRTLYDREPIPNRICQLMPRECWQLTPELYEDEDGDTQTDLEQDWDDLGRLLQPSGQSWFQDEKGSIIWEYLSRIDILSGIGQFGVLLLGIDDGKNLQDPVDGVEVVVNGEWIPDSPVSNAAVFFRDQESEPSDPKKPWELRGQVLNERQIRQIDAEANRLTNNQSVESLERSDKERGYWAGRYRQAVQNRRRYLQHVQRGDKGSARVTINQATPDDTLLWNARSSFATANARQTPNSVGSSVGPYASSPTGMGTSTPTSERGVTGSTGPGHIPLGGATPPSGPFVQGTDTSYDQTMWSGLGMAVPAGASLSGTDQQYFGIQFGPSQRFSDAPPKDKRKLLFLRCFDESLVQVVRYEWNIRNPRFGLPVMYRITLNDPRQPHSGVGLPLATVYVHWSRVIHIADNLHASEIFGVPRMRPNLNRVLDLRKIYAADGEGYWRNAFTILSAETHPQLGGDALLDRSEISNEFMRLFAGTQRQIVTRGLAVKTLAPQVVDPTPHIAVQLEAICIQLGCPVRVFKGSERGELASSQDDESWNERKRERQINYLTPKVIVPFVDRLIQLGILSLPRKKAEKAPAPQEPEGRLTPPPPDQPAPMKSVPPKQEDDNGSGSEQLPGQASFGKGAAGAGGVGGAGVSKGMPQPGNKTGGQLGGASPQQPPVPGAQPLRNRRWLLDNRRGRSLVVTNGRVKWTIPRGKIWILNAEGKPIGQQTDGGYSVEWPDLDALGAKDKAAICLQNTQALTTYIAQNGESVVHPMNYLTSEKFMGMDPEEAHQMLGATVQAQQEQESIHQDIADEHGMPPAPPPGFADKPEPPPPITVQHPGAPAVPGAKSTGAPAVSG